MMIAVHKFETFKMMFEKSKIHVLEWDGDDLARFLLWIFVMVVQELWKLQI